MPIWEPLHTTPVPPCAKQAEQRWPISPARVYGSESSGRTEAV